MFSFDYLSKLRLEEIAEVAGELPPGARVLEIGAGTGHQALALSRRGYAVSAIDIESTTFAEYASQRVFDVKPFRPGALPFPDASFDIVFSSNVLEHVDDLDALTAEMKRVLRPNGLCVHVLPTHSWRLWSSLAAIPASLQSLAHGKFVKAVKIAAAALLMVPHGEAGTALHELRSFNPVRWRELFERQRFVIRVSRPLGIFYTGEMIFGGSLSFAVRRRLARRLGSSTHLFVLGLRDGA